MVRKMDYDDMRHDNHFINLLLVSSNPLATNLHDPLGHASRKISVLFNPEADAAPQVTREPVLTILEYPGDAHFAAAEGIKNIFPRTVIVTISPDEANIWELEEKGVDLVLQSPYVSCVQEYVSVLLNNQLKLIKNLRGITTYVSPSLGTQLASVILDERKVFVQKNVYTNLQPIELAIFYFLLKNWNRGFSPEEIIKRALPGRSMTAKTFRYYKDSISTKLGLPKQSIYYQNSKYALNPSRLED